MTTYNFPGITYGGQASPDSLVAAIARINSLPTAADNSSAVLAALQATTIPVNIKQVNDVTVQGAGTKLNPWQPV